MLKKIASGLLALAATTTVFAQATAPAEAMSNPPIRLRGTIDKVEFESITVRERSGEVITLVRPGSMEVTEVVPIKLSEIKAGSYIGTAAMPQADGTQRAL